MEEDHVECYGALPKADGLLGLYKMPLLLLLPMPYATMPPDKKKKKKILILRVIGKSIHGIAKEFFQSQLKHWVLKPYKATVGMGETLILIIHICNSGGRILHI